MAYNLEEVRNKLFQTLQNLSEPKNGELSEMDIQAARQITEVSKLIIATGTAEMRYNRAVREGNNTKLAFFENKPNEPQKLLH
jgi:hypothetical protein